MDEEYTNDVMVWPTMTSLLGCVQEELDVSGRTVGRSTIAYGAEPPALDAGPCDGYLWVRLVDAYPAQQFPNQDFGPSPSGTRTPMAFMLEVAVARCLNAEKIDEDGRIFGANGQPLDPLSIFEDARAQMADMAAIRRGICKCLKASGAKYVLGNVASAAPSGLENYTGWAVTVLWDPDDD